MSKARELAELSRTVSDSADATAITIDSSEDVILSQDLRILDGKGARFGTDEDFTIYNDGSNTYLRNSTVNQDILFLGNDDGSANLQMLKLDASDAGNATFSGSVASSGLTVAGSTSGTVDGLIITNSSTTNNGLSIGVDSNENAFAWNGSNTNFNFATNNALAYVLGSNHNFVWYQSNGSTVSMELSASGALAVADSVTTGGYIQANGNIATGGAGRLRAGASNEVQLYFDGSHGHLANSTGNFTVDVAGDIILDADGADIKLLNGGTHWGSLYTNSTPNNLYLQNMVSDGDIYLSGSDGGVGINALVLDMSAAGAATFNNVITATGATFTNSSSGATPTGNTVLTVESNDNTELSILGGSSSVLALNFGHSGDNNEGLIYFNTTSGSENLQLQSTKDITYQVTSTNATAGHHKFLSHNTEIMRIDGQHNRVGIGTSVPEKLLTLEDAHPTIAFNHKTSWPAANQELGIIEFRTDWNGVGAKIQGVSDAQWGNTDYPGRLTFHTTSDGSASPVERLRISSSGDLILAANATGAALIKGVSGDQTDRNSGGYPQFTFVGNEGTGIRRPSANVLAFDTSGAEAARINSNGTIAINSTATNRELTIAAVTSSGQCDLALRASDDNNYCQLLFGDTSADNTGIVGYKNGDEFMFFNTGGAERMRISGDGKLIHQGKAGTSPIFEMINNDNEDNDTGRETSLRFSGHRSGGEDVVNAQISGHHDGSADDDKGMLFFYTNNGSGLNLASKIDSDGVAHFNGDVKVLSGDIQMGSGRGINFTASSNASGMSSETLNDYEEGVMQDSSSNRLLVGSTAGYYDLAGTGDSYNYTKIGRIVHVSGYLTVNGEASPSGVVALRLPFAIASMGDDREYGFASLMLQNHGASGSGLPTQRHLFIQSGDYAFFYRTNDSGGPAYIYAANIDSAWQMGFSFTYNTTE